MGQHRVHVRAFALSWVLLFQEMPYASGEGESLITTLHVRYA